MFICSELPYNYCRANTIYMTRLENVTRQFLSSLWLLSLSFSLLSWLLLVFHL